MTSPLLPSSLAPLPLDTPAPQRPSTRAPLPPSSSAPQHPSSLAPLLPDIPAPQPLSSLAPLPRLWEGWKSFSRDMGNFQSRILLGLFYFFIVTPFGVAVRALGDPLFLRRTGRSSNWIPRNDTTPANLDEAKKQF